MHKKNIYFIGLPGVGKTTIARALAKLMEYPYYDTDIEITKHYKKPIVDLLKQEGEEKFRQYEIDILQTLSQQSPIIVSTGGGIILQAVNRQCLQETGIVIYLTAPIEILSSRIAPEKDQRPLFDNKDIKEHLLVLQQQRISLYESTADFHYENAILCTNALIQKIYHDIQEK